MAGPGNLRMGMEKEERLEKCQELLQIKFQNPELLEEALTHSSAYHNGFSNERMEFLGDSILGLVVTEYLYRTYPEFSEGKLTKIKSVVVSRRTLAVVTKKLEVAQYCYFGQGIRKRPTIPSSIQANLFEALVGAIYLDQGYEAARKFILSHLLNVIELQKHDQNSEDFKSLLQDYCQKYYGLTPTYEVTDAEGPEHEKIFTVAVSLGDRLFEEGKGKSKKKAEQMAAKSTLSRLKKEKLNRDNFFERLFSEAEKESWMGKIKKWWQGK